MYDVPIFAIDVPMQQNEDNVQYVADQLRKLKDFIEECTGKKITDETLTERLRRSKRTLEKFAQYEKGKCGQIYSCRPCYATLCRYDK